MTAEELREIFNKAEIVTYGHGTPPMYQFYTFTARNRGGSVVRADGVEGLVETLAGFTFHEYAPGGVPVFYDATMFDKIKTPPAIENN